jgi:HD-GYP domain-containing protein (c-di-GMP phosphodiesterase class II)
LPLKNGSETPVNQDRFRHHFILAVKPFHPPNIDSAFKRSDGHPEPAIGSAGVLHDQSGGRVLERTDDDFESLRVVKNAVDKATVPALAIDDFSVITTKLEEMPFVGVALPLSNSANKVVAQVVGVFAISAEAMAEIRGSILLTVSYVIGLVMATALAIYPIIGRLLVRLSSQTERLLDSNLEILQVLGGAIAKRDSDTDAHNFRVSIYSVRLAETISLPRNEIRSLIKGALLHDVGKLAIRDNILLKQDKLTEDEFSIMKSHVEHGLEITARARWLKDADPVVGGHHEKFGGSGYPGGLSGDDIPLAARIFAIADVFDPLTSRRPYKAPMPFVEAARRSRSLQLRLCSAFKYPCRQ